MQNRTTGAPIPATSVPPARARNRRGITSCYLVRMLLVPSTVALLGRWNWWPSKMSRISAELPAGTADTVSAAPAASDHTAGEVAGGATGSKQPDPRH
jgi:hypothetical protein